MESFSQEISLEKIADRLMVETEQDIICRRLENSERFVSFKQTVWFAGGSAMGWGDTYDRSRNLSINILNRFIPGDEVQLYLGSVSQEAHRLSDRFLNDIVADMPKEGARLPVFEIKLWIKQNIL